MTDPTIEALAMSKAEHLPGDYIQDGLLHCGACHSRKETRVELFGMQRKVACLCRCQSEKVRRQLEEMEARQRIEALERKRAAAVQDPAYRKWTFEGDDGANPRVMEALRRYCQKWPEMKQQNLGLYLYGGVGTGKTFAAACVANELTRQGVPVLMASLVRMANALGWGEERAVFLRSLNAYDLLVMDDLGAQRGSDAMKEAVYQIIDSRYASGKPILVTTNLPWEQFQNPREEGDRRIYDRIREMTVAIQMGGQSRRHRLHEEKQNAARAMLLSGIAPGPGTQAEKIKGGVCGAGC